MEGLGVTAIDTDFWRGKRVVVTGHTGFKGSWLVRWLARLGADVTGIALAPHTTPALFTLADIGSICRSHVCDIRDADAVGRIVAAARPDILFHLAAQPLVRESYRAPVATFSTNVLGTVHVLDAIRSAGCIRASVIVTTDKVYSERLNATSAGGNGMQPFLESDRLGGHDPYSASKAAVEIAVDCYRRAFLAEAGTAIATARAGNVIGGGDWAADRIIPDAMRSWERGEPLVVRRPEACRPWQHVLEPLAAYLVLAEKLWHDPAVADAYNFGPDPAAAVSVRYVVDLARRAFGGGDVIFRERHDGPHESHVLALDATKATRILGVTGRWGLETAVARTVDWYCRQRRGESAASLCDADVAAFEVIA